MSRFPLLQALGAIASTLTFRRRADSSVRMQRIFRGHAVAGRRRAALQWGASGLAAALLLWPSPGRPDPEPLSSSGDHYSQSACYGLVRNVGRMIAWARWEQHYTYDRTLSMAARTGIAEWADRRVQGWVSDAYDWRATDEQIYQWAAELGNTDWLPRAAQLTTGETIAIWLRRIARGCPSDDATARGARDAT